MKKSVLFLMSIIGSVTAAILPEGYTQLEYVESTGSQYVNTGVFVGPQTRVVCDYQFCSIAFPRRAGGSNDENGDKVTFIWGHVYNDGTLGSIMSSTWDQREDTKVACDTARHVFNLRSGWQWMDKVRYGTHSFTSTSRSSLLLFGANLDGRKWVDYPCSMKIYACQVIERDYDFWNFAGGSYHGV